MLFRIYFDERWIPVNLPENTYSEAFLELLADRLTDLLQRLAIPGPDGWSGLQMIELESTAEGWQTSLYWNDRTVDAGSFYL